MAFSRRFVRKKLRRFRGRRTARRAKKILRRVRKRMFKRSARKARRKQYLYAYSYSDHVEAAYNNTAISGIAPNATLSGLFSSGDLDKIFDQVVQADDFARAGMATGNAQIKGNRHSLKIRVKGEVTYTIANGNTTGGIFVQIFIARPRQNLPEQGLGTGNANRMSVIYVNNVNSMFNPDYNDAAGVTVNAAGTGGVTNIVQNSTSGTKPALGQALWHTPFMVPEVTENFKILTVKKLYIPAGGVTMFKVKTPWTWIDRADTQLWNTDSTPRVYRGKWGRDVMVKAYGQPVHDQTTHTLVNTGRVTLDVVANKRYWYSTAARPAPSYFYGGDTLGTVALAQLPGLADQTQGEA